MPTTDYKDFLMEDLRDLDHAADYLTAAIEEGGDVFMLAVKDVAEALGGAGMLTDEGNPQLTSVTAVLDKLGLRVMFKPKLQGTNAA